MKGKRVKSTTVGQRDACSGCDGRFHAALRMGGRNDRGHLSIDAGSCGCAAARGPGSPARPFFAWGKAPFATPCPLRATRSCAANAQSIRMKFLFFGGANRFPRAPCRQAVQGETGAHPAQSGVAPSPNDIERRGGAFSGRGKRIRSGEGARETGRTGRNGLGGEQREAPGRQAARGRFGRGDWPARHANARGKHAARPPGRRLGRHAPHTPSAA